MLKIMKSVKIIKAIEYAFNVDLKLMRRLSPRRVRIPSEVTWFPVCVKEHPSMVSSTKFSVSRYLMTGSSSSALMFGRSRSLRLLTRALSLSKTISS